jgi:archaeal type IV pilus assembly protein PilA
LNNFFNRVICVARNPKGMDTRRPSFGVSPIIATLLLIAITVAAGVIVYVFVSGTVGNLTHGGGQQTGEQIELTAYSFTPLGGSGLTCNGNATVTGPCLTISIKDAGGSSVTIDSIFFDGQKLTPNAALTTTPITLTTDGNAIVLIANNVGASGTKGWYTGLPTGLTGGSSHTLKIVSATGGLFAYTVTAGSSQ